jgi:hypothetical protein
LNRIALEPSNPFNNRTREHRQSFDVIMNNKYARQPEKLRAWQSASRVERVPQREKKPAPAAGGTTPPKSPGT